jgi:hypothetical protein
MGYNELLLRDHFSEEFKTKLDQKAKAVFSLYSELVKKEGCILIVVLQADGAGREYDFSAITEYLHTLSNVRVYDLMPYYRGESIKNKNDLSSYYWKHDGHHTSNGYALMARGIEKAIDSFYINQSFDTSGTRTRRMK